MRFAFHIYNHFGFSAGADDDLQGNDANFGALIDERSLYNALMAIIGSSPLLERVRS